jgi:DNA-binding beta-propeller fold protein YncE
MVAVIDTRDDSLLGPWDSNPLTTNGRVHAAVFSKDGNTLYLANEGANEVSAIDPRTGYTFWRMTVPAVQNLRSRTTANERT